MIEEITHGLNWAQITGVLWLIVAAIGTPIISCLSINEPSNKYSFTKC
ncbi:hypothetical protein [Lentilactobacillus kefiri]|uniref:Uncharacterized protein n=1 Tax=Lentilactobacillus kefiri TaxID=33962 RepID=A0A511DWF3_LENKE|nr:hypothetical protein [Lentilactobacillus kefiri]MCJ2162709.1 hypothetical protein [Lentilactobacillus kefiri]MCP9369982.1 hypothetical protein [Lentilactobacillus kefiri]MDH5109281.1 hypothetical protein [Lentilactobacillus kefiri]MDM7493682.1 hypothetical protein [Lentilactobacillus kefiri]UOD78086.1 hypothetical protein MTO92_10590 [Lentilactobacillus kefiri]